MQGDSGREEKGECSECEYWRPHVFYSYIGFCEKHKRFTLDNDTCPFFKRIKIRDGEFYWCSTCRSRVTGEEARKLVVNGHKIHRGAYVDPDIREELYSVF